LGSCSRIAVLGSVAVAAGRSARLPETRSNLAYAAKEINANSDMTVAVLPGSQPIDRYQSASMPDTSI